MSFKIDKVEPKFFLKSQSANNDKDVDDLKKRIPGITQILQDIAQKITSVDQRKTINEAIDALNDFFKS